MTTTEAVVKLVLALPLGLAVGWIIGRAVIDGIHDHYDRQDYPRKDDDR